MFAPKDLDKRYRHRSPYLIGVGLKRVSGDCHRRTHSLSCPPMVAKKTTSGVERCGTAYLLLFEDGGAFFVGEDGGFELAEIGGFFCRDFDLADDEFALVVERTGLGGDGGVVGGEVHVDGDGVGGFIDGVAGGQGDVEAVAPVACGAELDGEGAGLVVKRHRSEE